jgi:hypothetical protein
MLTSTARQRNAPPLSLLPCARSTGRDRRERRMPLSQGECGRTTRNPTRPFTLSGPHYAHFSQMQISFWLTDRPGRAGHHAEASSRVVKR